MRNPIVSPRYEEKHYKGQDVVHEGIRIPLQKEPPAELLKKFSRRAQRIIDDAKPVSEDSLRFKYAAPEDLPALRALWFNPEDPTFPDTLDEHTGTVAIRDDKIIGGALWKPEGNNLFLHQLIASPEAKREGIPTRLIWESVLMYYRGAYHALDIGVSYNPKRYAFFKHFAVETYPIILKKPFYVPVIRLSPFRTMPDQERAPAPPMDWKARNATFLPRGSAALYAALKHAGIAEGDMVVIVKTFGSDFISACVTDTIEKAGGTWNLYGPGRVAPNPLNRVRAVIALHEFGIPIYQEGALKILQEFRDHDVPIIEDCAWRTKPVWDWSTYKVFSMQKMMNINYGGVLWGAHIDDETLWSWGVLDTVKRDRLAYEPIREGDEAKRRGLWKKYHEYVLADGMTPDDCYDYAGAIERKEWLPTVYLQKFQTDAIADAIVERLEAFGIQAGRYWGEPIVYLPIHDNMSSAEVSYMFAVVKGYFNECRDYQGK